MAGADHVEIAAVAVLQVSASKSGGTGVAKADRQDTDHIVPVAIHDQHAPFSEVSERAAMAARCGSEPIRLLEAIIPTPSQLGCR